MKKTLSIRYKYVSGNPIFYGAGFYGDKPVIDVEEVEDEKASDEEEDEQVSV